MGNNSIVKGPKLTGSVTKTDQYPIGHGGLTDVYKGELKSGLKVTLVAIKMFRVVHTDTKNLEIMSRRLIRESNAWSRLKHDNIQPYFGYCEIPEIGPSLALVSPFCSNGTILNYLTVNPKLDRFHFVEEILSGLVYLHQEGIIHGDLTGKNVLIDDKGHARLTDFGRAIVIGDDAFKTSLFAGYTEYMAPELFLEDEKVDDEGGSLFSMKSDIYAFSMLAFQIFTDNAPLRHEGKKSTPGSLILRIIKGERPLREYDSQKRISDEVWKLMESCWSPEKAKRPPAVEVLLKMRGLVHT